MIDPEDPDQLLAAHSGYVFYAEDGRITVKEELNVRGDVDYATGDIGFVGDLVVHGQVRAGFEVSARRVLVKSLVEGAVVRSLKRIECPGGIKAGGYGLVDAGTDLRTAFCENATLRAGRHVLVETNALHCTVFARGKLGVKGRITGGEYHFLKGCEVGGQLGGGLNAATVLMGGYDPELIWLDRQLVQRAADVREDLAQWRALAERGGELAEEYGPKADRARDRLDRLEGRRTRLWERFMNPKRFDDCRIRVRGRVRPGVEIGIGPAHLRVAEELENVSFYYDDGEVRIRT
jgi:hypothetical protein